MDNLNLRKNVLELEDDLVEYKPRDESETSVVIYLKPRYRLKTCPKCNGRSLNRNGYSRDRRIRDTNHHNGKFLELNIKAPRYKCKDCGKTTTHPLKSIHPSRGMTNRLVAAIEEKVRSNSYMNIAREYGFGDNGIQTIKRIGDAYFKEMENKLDLLKPINKLGILIIKVKEKNRLFFIDLDTYDSGPSLVDIQDIRDKVNDLEFEKALKHMIPKKIELVLTEPDKYLNKWINLDTGEIDRVIYGPSVLRRNKKALREVFDRVSFGTTNYLTSKDLNTHRNKRTLSSLSETKPEFTPYYNFYLEHLESYDKPRGFYKQLAMTYCVENNNKSLGLFKDFFEDMLFFKEPIVAYDTYVDEWDSLYQDIKDIISHIEKLGNGYSYDALRKHILFGTNATQHPVHKKPTREQLVSHMTAGTPIPLEVGFHVPISELLKEVSKN